MKDIQFEKGMVVAIDVLSIHYSQEYWGPEDPEKFFPLRHAPEFKRNPAAFLPFGYGPRSKNQALIFLESFDLIQLVCELFEKAAWDRDSLC